MTGGFPEDYKFERNWGWNSAKLLCFLPFSDLCLGLKPVFDFVARLFATLNVEFVGSTLNESIASFRSQRPAHPRKARLMIARSKGCQPPPVSPEFTTVPSFLAINVKSKVITP